MRALIGFFVIISVSNSTFAGSIFDSKQLEREIGRLEKVEKTKATELREIQAKVNTKRQIAQILRDQNFQDLDASGVAEIQRLVHANLKEVFYSIGESLWGDIFGVLNQNERDKYDFGKYQEELLLLVEAGIPFPFEKFFGERYADETLLGYYYFVKTMTGLGEDPALFNYLTSSMDIVERHFLLVYRSDETKKLALTGSNRRSARSEKEPHLQIGLTEYLGVFLRWGSTKRLRQRMSAEALSVNFVRSLMYQDVSVQQVIKVAAERQLELQPKVGLYSTLMGDHHHFQVWRAMAESGYPLHWWEQALDYFSGFLDASMISEGLLFHENTIYYPDYHNTCFSTCDAYFNAGSAVQGLLERGYFEVLGMLVDRNYLTDLQISQEWNENQKVRERLNARVARMSVEKAKELSLKLKASKEKFPMAAAAIESAIYGSYCAIEGMGCPGLP